MHEDRATQAEQTVDNPQPDRVETHLSLQDPVPGEEWVYFYRDPAFAKISRFRASEEESRLAEMPRRKAEEWLRRCEEDRRKIEASLRLMIARRRQKGHTDADIADDLGCTVQELQERFPPQT
jgi:hypothetical protein